MKKLLLFLFLCPLFLQAQDSASLGKPSRFVILKASPLSLIDPVPSLQLAVEYQPGSKGVSLQHEAGYITNLVVWENELKNLRGLRLRNEIRFYLQPRGKTLEGLYIAPEFLYIKYRHEKTGTICHGSDGESFNCDYWEKADYLVEKQVFAFHPKLGFQSIYKGLTVDLYAGPGFRHVRVKEIGVPENGIVEEDYYFNFKKRPGRHNVPGLSLGFKIGYVISKKGGKNLP